MINMNKSLVETAMIFDQKPLDKRLTKLTEEFGELGEAILADDKSEILEESIDVLVVALSIYLDLGKNLEDAELVINSTFSENTISDNLYRSHIQLSVLNGLFAESLQKYLGVATSVYKGISSKEQLTSLIAQIMQGAVEIIKTQSLDGDVISETINKKNGKWKKNAMKGFILSSKNQTLIKKDKEFVDSFVDFAKQLANEHPVYIHSLNYHHIEHRLEQFDSLESVFIESPHAELRDIVVIYNVPLDIQSTLSRCTTSIKLICVS